MGQRGTMQYSRESGMSRTNVGELDPAEAAADSDGRHLTCPAVRV